MKKEPYRIYLSENEMPKQWYNIRADMKEQPDPYLHPATHQPVVPRLCCRFSVKSCAPRR